VIFSLTDNLCSEYRSGQSFVPRAGKAGKAADAIEEVKAVAPNVNASFIECDLSSLASVKKAAEEFNSRSPRLDVLMCNAGISWIHPETTIHGYEMIFGTNHLGHALLIKLLLPKLLKTTAAPDSDVRIVILSSMSHREPPKEGITFRDLKTTLADMPFKTRYAQSKLANVLYARSLAKKYPNIKTVSVHPGFVDMNMPNRAVLKDSGWGLHSPEDGVKTQLWAATAEKDEVVSGTYYEPVAVTGKDSKLSNDKKLMEELWDWTEKQWEKFPAS
jgi:NAD(P)-dependent dehydrogenase (short-subunit alcohol dehydrogenase family)